MISVFKKQNEKDKTSLLESVRKTFDIRLRKWAAYLSRKAERIPEQKLAKTLMAIFLVIILLLICRLVYLYKHRNEVVFHSIRAPVPMPSHQLSVDAMVLERIRHFHHYLDSINRNDEPLYDSMMKKRPHLIDSIIIIERFTNE